MVNYKTLGDAIGMPDEQDKAFLRKLILTYEREHPGIIKYTIDQAKKEQDASNGPIKKRTDFGLVDSHSSRRHILELPAGLIIAIEQYYPTLFREKKHFAWFIKNFREFLIPDRY